MRNSGESLTASLTASLTQSKQNKQPRPLTWADGARREGFEPPTARSVAWCSASIWSAPDGSGLLTLGGPSVQTAPDGYRRIVWMIKRMIKPCDAAPSVTQTTAGIVERSPDIPSGDAWWTATRTTTSGCRGSVAAATRWRSHAEAEADLLSLGVG